MNTEVDANAHEAPHTSGAKVSIVIPNWNGKESLGACLGSLLGQRVRAHIIVVENGSSDGSLEFLRQQYPSVEVIMNAKNLGFAGGVNCGIRRAIERGDEFVALFNNDAVAEPDWLGELLRAMQTDTRIGITTCKFMSMDRAHLDSTGDLYTIWGLPYPRGRDEPVSDKYDSTTEVFGASGGASLFRTAMLTQIGLFDEDFFAYYEDVDISFRAQLAGWRVQFAPDAIAYHSIGATSSKIKGFTTYQTIKNYPWVFWKNVPMGRVFWHVLPRVTLAYWLFVASAVARGQGWPAVKGLAVSLALMPKKLAQRWRIQHNRTVSAQYISSIITHDLPPNAYKLRTLRAAWWKMKGKRP